MSAGAFQGTERFRLVSRLGVGGMGVVFEALDTERRSRVALKLLPSLQPDALLRFKHEFRTLQDIHHPHLAALGELVCEGPHWFFTMELVDGVDFLSWVRGADRAGARERASPAAGPRDVTAPLDGTTGGTAPLAPAPAAGDCDQGRLRGALIQLADVLLALHTAGKVHRDIKPSNVLVTGEGRLVLLDFGLVADVGPESRPAGAGVLGTVDYVAPEQTRAGAVGPAADWYSAGVMLYQALTGELPFAGSPAEVIRSKCAGEPAPPRARAPGIPADLDTLCRDLLRLRAGDRLDGRQVLQRLVPRQAGHSGYQPGAAAGAAPFVGRAAELGTLAEALAATRSGQAAAVLVSGESGVGKSALVRRFVDGLAAAEPEVVELAGRCFERESVPYKAFDGVVDALARHLAGLTPADIAAALPANAGLLGQIFPVLSRVDAIAQAARAPRGVHDPWELRTRLFDALRGLIAWLARRSPVVIVIDDLQWADGDSLALLRDLIRPPDPPPVLLVATRRTGERDDDGGDLLGEDTGNLMRISLGNLPPALAESLARSLLDGLGRADPADTGAGAAIAAEAGGHPLFIQELVRHTAIESAGDRPRRLEDALGARIARLSTPAQRVLELVALSGMPLPQDTLAGAAELESATFDRQVAELRAARLIRTSGARGADPIEPYHDRVRQAVLGRMDGDSRPHLHARLVAGLESSAAADPEALAVHAAGAGWLERAAGYAERAAARAADALAFERAARLYQQALAWAPADAEATRVLRTRLGDALVNAGRGTDAAHAYLAAVAGAGPAERIDLQRRAAEQLLRSGHIDEGLEAIASVLSALGMSLPRTPRRALLSLLRRRLRVRLHGLRWREQPTDQIDPAMLSRLDACWSVSQGLALVDTIRGADFQARHMLLALKAGEPFRVARALSAEAAYAASAGDRSAARAPLLLECAGAVVGRLAQPEAAGLATLCAGIVAFLGGRWRQARDLCDGAEDVLRDRCAGVAWELSSTRLFALLSLAWLGELRELARRVPLLLRQSEERGDLYAATCQRTGLANLAWLAAGDVAEARYQMRTAARQWSHQAFHFQHYWSLLARTQIELYVGDGGAAWRMVGESWAALTGSMYLRIPHIRMEARTLRGRSALAAAESSADPAGLLAEVRREARAVARRATAPARGLAALLEAGVHGIRREPDQALAELARAAGCFDEADMAVHAAVARRRQGELLGGDDGRRAVAAADELMASQRIASPRRMAAMLAPGFPEPARAP